MHTKRFLALALVMGPALLLLADCSNAGSPQLPSATSPLSLATRFASIDDRAPAMPARSSSGLVFVDPATLKGQIFVAAYNPSGSTPVSDYNVNNTKNKGSFCQITSIGEGINALGVDSANELWVPQALDLNSGVPDIVSYAPNCGAAGETLADSKGQPAGIAFASDGTRYVNNILGPSSSAGNVAVYPQGKKKPTRLLTDSKIYFANGIGVDSKGNIYVSFFTQSSTTGVMEFKGGRMPGTVLKKIKNGAPGAIAFDKSDHLIITDDSAVTLNIYAPPYDKAPKTYPIQGHSPQCSLNKAQTNLACADKTNTTVDIYSYPAGKYLYSFGKGLTPTIIGTAQDPR